MQLTKNDMARVVIQALCNLPELPTADLERVVRMARKKKKDLEASYRAAVIVLEQRIGK